MRKYRVVVLALFSYLWLSLAQANNMQAIQAYIQRNFPPSFTVNDAQLAQLAWAFQHDKHTNDSDALVNNQKIYVEVSRALTRLYCAQLLRLGTREAYQQFVEAQLQTGVPEPLSFASFAKFAQHMQNLTPADYSLIESVSILSSVSLSKPAEALAQQALDVTPIIHDNMNFLAATVRNGINIYPLTAQILQDNTAAKKLLYILFPPQTNFRHMLYTEGGIGMFKYLRTMITQGFIDRNGLDIWYAHWIINIAAFRGHIAQRGGLYLQEPVALCMLRLKDLVYEMLDVPNFNPLMHYLEYRAQLLGLDHLPRDQKLFYAHLACLLRLYDANAGQSLYAIMQDIPPQNLYALKKSFLNGLQDANQNANMYIPALLGNALQLNNGDLARTLPQILPIYNAILQQAARQNFTRSLSFNHLSASKNVALLLQPNALDKCKFEITADGNVLLLK